MDSTTGLLGRYLASSPSPVDSAAVAYYAALDTVADVSPVAAAAIVRELQDQRDSLKLIASENYSSLASQLAQGNLFSDKYAEGYPGHRFYAGCDNVDLIEAEAARLACELFGADHAYVQPHSGADANLVAFSAIVAARVQAPALERMGLEDPSKATREQWEAIRVELASQKLLALDYYSGGHLTHGYRHNISARLFDVYQYAVDRDSGLLDLEQIRQQALEVRPLVLLAGYSAYPRRINFQRLREIADEVGAVFMVDMAHFAGLVAGKVFDGPYDPVAHAHIVTTTTHKTLRGPRGGMVLCKAEFAEWVDKGCPAILGGPLPQVMAAKAVAFKEASRPEFAAYAQQIVENAATLAGALVEQGVEVVTGTSENHLLLVDVEKTYGLNGRQAESALRAAGITLNRNSLPFDANGPWYTSGLRIGTPAVTTLGMGSDEMREIASIITLVLGNTKAATTSSGKPSRAKFVTADGIVEQARERVRALTAAHPLYPQLDAELLASAPWLQVADAAVAAD
ncbi:MAG TPA: glycine hydroxymethyltransferase [Thermomicrobiales bacterium]|jgi:glycine hydroxymethyltransferase|nr:glycine hydroxymethyltransferase [Thermomicrobiales bacterium]